MTYSRQFGPKPLAYSIRQLYMVISINLSGRAVGVKTHSLDKIDLYYVQSKNGPPYKSSQWPKSKFSEMFRDLPSRGLGHLPSGSDQCPVVTIIHMSRCIIPCSLKTGVFRFATSQRVSAYQNELLFKRSLNNQWRDERMKDSKFIFKDFFWHIDAFSGCINSNLN